MTQVPVTSSSWSSSLFAGAGIAFTQTAMAVALGAFVFGGQNAASFTRGAVAFLLSAAIANVVIAFTTKLSTLAIGLPNTTAVVLSGVFVSLGPLDPATLFTLLALSVFVTGAALYILGHIGAGEIIRFLPYPVLSAYLGGVGALLLLGGVGEMRNEPTTLMSVLSLTFWADYLLILPGVALTAILVLARNRQVSPVVQNAVIVVAVVGFFVVARSQLDNLGASGWVIGSASDLTWRPVTPQELASADFGAIFQSAPALLAVTFVTALGLLLNSSGVATELEVSSDPNAELKAIGLANLAAAPVGGAVTHHSAAITKQARTLGGNGRAMLFVASGLVVAAAIFGGANLALFPRFVAGALLANLGTIHFGTWLTDGLRRSSTIERVVGASVVLSMLTVGILPGLGVGVVASILLFVVRYSSIGPIRAALSGNSFRSSVDRSTDDRMYLQAHVGATLALLLRGYLFFGSAKQIEDAVQRRLADRSKPALRYLVLNFRAVTGMDASTMSVFRAINRVGQRAGVTIVWSAADRWADRFAVTSREAAETVVYQPDLDHAIAWCESQFLSNRGQHDLTVVMDEDTQTLQTIFQDQAQKRLLSANDELIRVGDTSDSIFFVEFGTLTVWLDQDSLVDVRLRQVGFGSLLGGVAFSTGQPRTASVRADTDAVIWELPRSTMNTLMVEAPATATALNVIILRRMSDRLSAATEMVAALLQENTARPG